MKYRKDFVTNSSSSSYICEICGDVESGMDMGLLEAGMVECVNGHIICSRHTDMDSMSKEDIIALILKQEQFDFTEEDLKDKSREDLLEDCLTDYGYGLLEEMCPICRFDEYSEDNLAAFLLKEYKVDREVVFSEIKKFNKRRKKLYDSEYITYVCQQFNLNPIEIVNSWKTRFGTYKDFKNFIK